MVQISMNGLNVNWKLFKELQKYITAQHAVTLLNVGRCGLHQVHGAFKAVYDVSGWEIDKLLSSIYWHFKDTHARREDFTSLTGCAVST
jgi:hypothetical protein